MDERVSVEPKILKEFSALSNTLSFICSSTTSRQRLKVTLGSQIFSNPRTRLKGSLTRELKFGWQPLRSFVVLVLTVHSNTNTVVGCQTPSARALSARNAPSARSALPHDPLADAGPHIVQERQLQQSTVGPRCIGGCWPKYTVNRTTKCPRHLVR